MRTRAFAISRSRRSHCSTVYYTTTTTSIRTYYYFFFLLYTWKKPVTWQKPAPHISHLVEIQSDRIYRQMTTFYSYLNNLQIIHCLCPIFNGENWGKCNRNLWKSLGPGPPQWYLGIFSQKIINCFTFRYVIKLKLSPRLKPNLKPDQVKWVQVGHLGE